jgi:hypothetical protein
LLALLCAGFGVPTTLAAPPKADAHEGREEHGGQDGGEQG